MYDWYLSGWLLWLCNTTTDVYLRLADVNGLPLSLPTVTASNYKYHSLAFIYFLNTGLICFRKVYEDNHSSPRMSRWNISRLFKFSKSFQIRFLAFINEKTKWQLTRKYGGFTFLSGASN